MQTYKEIIARVERDALANTLEECKYNVARAARVLQLSRGTLRKKLKQHFGDIYFAQSGG